MDLAEYWQRCCIPYFRARFGKTERGASVIEYALLIAMIAIACIGAITFLGSKPSAPLNSAGSAL